MREKSLEGGALWLGLSVVIFLFCHSFFVEQKKNTVSDGVSSSGWVHVQVKGLANRDGIYVLPDGSGLMELFRKLGLDEKEVAGNYMLGDFSSIEFSEVSPFWFSLGKMREGEIYLLGYTMDLNRAEVRDLVLLPKIGPSLARRIVRERKVGGPFSSLEDLTRVKGLTRKSIAEIQALVTVGPRMPLGGVGKNGR